jgi:Ca2+-dependent lipid-binding protein
VQANDLQKMDWTGSSDPYVSLAVDGKGKDKTRYLEKNLDPEWSLAPLSVLFSRAAAIRSPDGA